MGLRYSNKESKHDRSYALRHAYFAYFLHDSRLLLLITIMKHM